MFYNYNLVSKFLFVKRNISKMFMNLFLNSTLVCNDFFSSQADKLGIAGIPKVRIKVVFDEVKKCQEMSVAGSFRLRLFFPQ
jgi:hypothetical protein